MIPEVKTAVCELCNGNRANVVFSYTKPDQYEAAVGVASNDYYRYWLQCTDCGFYYSLYSRQPDDLDRLYESGYRADGAPWRRGSPEEIFKKIVALPKGESETKFRVSWIKESIAQIWSSGLVRAGSPPYRLLDVGGATGVFAYEFRDEQWNPYVIDPDESGQFVERQLNIPFLQRKYEPKSFNFTFDLVSLVFVLEHIADPAGLLKAIHRDTGPNSLLYIEVPSDVSFKLKDPEDDIFNSCHLWMFGSHTLPRLLSSCGFEVFCLNCVKTKRGHYALMTLVGRK